MDRIKLPLAPGINVEFTDRGLALGRVEDWAGRGMAVVHVVYGPEGCGKTAWLRQSVGLLRELGFDVVYVNPMDKEQFIEVNVVDLRRRFLEIVNQAFTENSLARIAWAAYELAHDLIKAGRRKIAILADDVFQAIGLDKASLYVKALLNLIEYPPAEYDVVIAVAATSEGISKREIGRHEWANLRPMWNMPKEGFRQLYEQIPEPKPNFEEAWKLMGGNPKLLGQLYRTHWNINEAVNEMIRSRGLINLVKPLSGNGRELLIKALDDPGVLMSREGMPLLSKLLELNLIIDNIYLREEYL